MERWPTGCAAALSGGGRVIPGGPGDQPPPEIRARGEHMEREIAGGRGGVDILPEADQANLPFPQSLT